MYNQYLQQELMARLADMEIRIMRLEAKEYSSSGGTVAYDWWEAGGSISASAVLEHVESPSIGQLYAGSAVASGQPWTIAFRGDGYDANTPQIHAFDTQTGRFVIGFASTFEYGMYITSAWANVDLFQDTSNHVWFIVSSGTSIQGYIGTVATGAVQASSVGIGGTTRWRSAYVGTASNQWGNDISHAAVYSIALDAGQRAALYTTMTT